MLKHLEWIWDNMILPFFGLIYFIPVVCGTLFLPFYFMYKFPIACLMLIVIPIVLFISLHVLVISLHVLADDARRTGTSAGELFLVLFLALLGAQIYFGN